MRNKILRASLRALCLTLIVAICATGAYAVHLTHVYAAVTITFGTRPDTETKAIPTIAINDILGHAATPANQDAQNDKTTPLPPAKKPPVPEKNAAGNR